MIVGLCELGGWWCAAGGGAVLYVLELKTEGLK